LIKKFSYLLNTFLN